VAGHRLRHAFPASETCCNELKGVVRVELGAGLATRRAPISARDEQHAARLTCGHYACEQLSGLGVDPLVPAPQADRMRAASGAFQLVEQILWPDHGEPLSTGEGWISSRP
jgi:hypothetical protein